MKKLFFILVLTIALFTSCSKDKDGKRAKLPAVTTEGKNTFGCRINGEIFVPKGSSSFYSASPLMASYYYYQYPESDTKPPGFYLFLHAFNKDTGRNIEINLTKSDVPLVQGQTYPIVLKGNGAVDAQYSFYTYTPHPDHGNVSIFNSYEYETTNEYAGELKIIKFDETNRILSATFSFDALNNANGKSVSVTEGRFDVKYAPF